MKYGLKQEDIDAINGVFASHPHIEKAILYGSRAKGTFKNGSDIDLSLIAPGVSLTELFEIENELDDLLLPYMIDLSLLHRLKEPRIIDHIQRVGIDFYTA